MPRTSMLLAIVLLFAAHTLAAQNAWSSESGSRFDSLMSDDVQASLRLVPTDVLHLHPSRIENTLPMASMWQQGMRRREPVLAGVLSFLVPFGTGSFYAGNIGHGVRHFVIGGALVGIGLASFCLESCTSEEETFVAIAFFGLIGNWIAGTVTAVLDANSFNRREATAGMRLAPAVKLLAAPSAPGSALPTAPTVGLRLVAVSF